MYASFTLRIRTGAYEFDAYVLIGTDFTKEMVLC